MFSESAANLSTIVKSRVPVRYVGHLHLLCIATYYVGAERKCRSILVDGFGEKKRRKPNEKECRDEREEEMGARGCGAQARDRKAGGKTAHAPSPSTWRITCCPLLKPPCLHLPPLRRSSPPPPRLSSFSPASHSTTFDSAQPFGVLSFPCEPFCFFSSPSLALPPYGE